MIQLNWSTLSPKITEVGTWLYLNGNYYWRGPGFTSMIMGGRVSTPTSPYIIDHRFSYKHQKNLHHKHKHHSSKHQFLSSLLWNPSHLLFCGQGPWTNWMPWNDQRRRDRRFGSLHPSYFCNIRGLKSHQKITEKHVPSLKLKIED